MMSAGSAVNPPASPVSFPSFDSPTRQQHRLPHTPPPHLPFRKISLPSNVGPPALHRFSVVSIASFDSLPEDAAGDQSQSAVPAVMRNVNAARKAKARPPSLDAPRKSRKRESAGRPADDAREAKRRKVVEEFLETERAYLDGLELIYSHFLTPIIASLETATPLLDRSSLTSVFSNFIDIWNLHHSFYSALSTYLSKYGFTSSSSSELLGPVPETPPLSPILLAHFPYLSLYNPFVTAFPTTISALSNLITPSTPNRPNSQYNVTFATYLAAQESDSRCGKLKLRDWLLTIVQRCPRYLLLLKDLINNTNPDDPEHGQLMAVHTLVSKITLSLNTSLHTHAQTLALLSLQRNTPNLPFQLIVPGRTLIKRGSLVQIERSDQPREREFLLFSDCLIWLASEEVERAWKGDWGIGRGGWGAGYSNMDALQPLAAGNRLEMLRRRSKSEAELSLIRSPKTSTPAEDNDQAVTTPPPPAGKKHYVPPPVRIVRRQGSAGTSGGEEKWVFKGRAELVDLEVVVLVPPRDEGDERRFEILSPGGSFVLYASSEAERDEWSTMIRQAKAQLLISLNITHPNSTLTSSASTNHIRRTLQALPFPPSDERLDSPVDSSKGSKASKRAAAAAEQAKVERRRKVEHWVPAIWIPDEKTEGCMRCGRPFGWRRRRHHCRLCGRCVCAACSGRTFFISDSSSKDSSTKPARACDACYETVFPLVNSQAGGWEHLQDGQSVSKVGSDTLHSLSNIPSLISVPSPLQQQHAAVGGGKGRRGSKPPPVSSAQALMAIDREVSLSTGYSEYHRDEDIGGVIKGAVNVGEGRGRVKMVRESARPRSYHQIMAQFADVEGGVGNDEFHDKNDLHEHDRNDNHDEDHHDNVDKDDDDGDVSDDSSFQESIPSSQLSPRPQRVRYMSSSANNTPPASPARNENTARRSKRFSLPAVALQALNVTTRSQQVDEPVAFPDDPNGSGDAQDSRQQQHSAAGFVRSKRFSLVLGRSSHGGAKQQQQQHSELSSPSTPNPAAVGGDGKGAGELAMGIAAVKLNELLQRKRG